MNQLNNKYQSKTILITGGAGYIGSVLIQKLLNLGVKVKVLDCLLYGKKHLAKFKRKPNFSLIPASIENTKTVAKAIKNVDAIVHLAAIVGDLACELNPQKAYQINYKSTLVVADLCKHSQVNRFVFASSCSVYGISKPKELLTEKSQLNPLSLYAKLKVKSEKAILKMANNSFSPTVLRLASVFGPSPRMRFDIVINALTAKAINEGKITIFNGNQWRSYIHVNDVAKAINLTLKAPLEKVAGEVFNLGSNENNFTINNIGKFIKQIAPEVNLIYQKKNIDKRSYKVDFSKIKKALGFRANKNVLTGIKEIKKAFKAGQYKDWKENYFYNHKIKS